MIDELGQLLNNLPSKSCNLATRNANSSYFDLFWTQYKSQFWFQKYFYSETELYSSVLIHSLL
jgi:hypothetical protein